MVENNSRKYYGRKDYDRKDYGRKSYGKNYCDRKDYGRKDYGRKVYDRKGYGHTDVHNTMEIYIAVKLGRKNKQAASKSLTPYLHPNVKVRNILYLLK